MTITVDYLQTNRKTDTGKTLKPWPVLVDHYRVNTDPEQVDIAPLLAKHGISYPVLRDQLHITQDRYQVIGTPTSIVIDARGRVRDLHQGWRKPEELQAVFTRLAQP